MNVDFEEKKGGYIRILLTKSRDVKWWMKNIEKQPK
jgi:ribosomal protein L17